MYSVLQSGLCTDYKAESEVKNMSLEYPVDLQAHTLTIHKNPVSEQEAKIVCRICQTAFSDISEVVIPNPLIKGVNEIVITPHKRYVDGVEVAPAYDLKILINIGRILGFSGFSMVALSSENVAKLIKKIDRVLSKLRLNVGNDCSENWHIWRLDSGIDLRLCTDDNNTLREYIRCFHASFNPDVRGYSYTTYKGYERPEVQYESVTIQNKLGRYNIYYKLQQMLGEYPEMVTQEVMMETANIIRIEKQLGVIENDGTINPKGLSNAIGKGNPKTLKSLLDEEVTEKMLSAVFQDIRLLFGTGDFVPYEEGLEIIRNSRYSETEKRYMELLYKRVEQEGTYKKAVELMHHNCIVAGGNTDYDDLHKRINILRKKIESLGISVVASHTGKKMDGFDKLIENEVQKNRKPRKKSATGKLIACRQPNRKIRYQSNMTLHLPDGTTKRGTLFGKVGENYDDADYSILCKLRDKMLENRKKLGNDRQAHIQYLQGFLEDLRAYQKLNHCNTMQKNILDAIEQVEDRISRLQIQNNERK